jgi:hypothetical protein
MEPTMNKLMVLSTVAIMALALPIATSTASFARPGGHGGGGHGGGHGGGFHGGGGHFHGGGFHRGGGFRGGGFHRGGGFIPGAIAGAVIGGALAAPYGYGGYGYGYAPDYYDDGYDDGPTVEVAPGGGGNDVAYCQQTYKSYDVRSGTYLGYDGLRHPCP